MDKWSSVTRRKVPSYFWEDTTKTLLYVLLVNSTLKIQDPLGIGKGTYIIKGKRPFMKESDLFTVANQDQFIEGSLINKGKDRTLKSRNTIDKKIKCS